MYFEKEPDIRCFDASCEGVNNHTNGQQECGRHNVHPSSFMVSYFITSPFEWLLDLQICNSIRGTQNHVDGVEEIIHDSQKCEA